MQTGGQIGGLAQPTALGASVLTLALGVTHPMVMDGQCCPGRWLPVVMEDWAHRCIYAGPCESQAEAQAKHMEQARVWGEDSAFLYTCVCMSWREAIQCSGYLFTYYRFL